MQKPVIKRCEDNQAKRKTAASLKTKAKIAIYNKAFVEAIGNEYAFMENRLKSILFHIGILPSRKEDIIPANVLSGTLQKGLKIEEGKGKSVKNITGKITAFRAFVRKLDSMSQDELNSAPAVYSQLSSLAADKKEIDDGLKRIQEWLRYRNEITHASYEKNIEDLEAKGVKIANDGFVLANWIDKISKRVKRTIKRASRNS